MSLSHRPPWRATAYALGHVAVALPIALLFAGVTVAAALIPVGVGVVLIRPLTPLISIMAAYCCRMAGSFLERDIAVAPLTAGGFSPWGTVIGWFGTRAFWQRVGWLAFAATGGLVLSCLVVGMPLGALATIATAFGLWGSGTGLGFVPPLLLGCGLALILLWWFMGDSLLRWRAQTERAILRPDRSDALQRRVADLTVTRAETVDASAAEVRRIERDLHDGAQARLVALGMNLGMAADLLDRDPEAARRLLDEARTSTGAALGDIRAVVRGIHPPVLSDRGLIGAVQALALDLPLPVTVDATLPGRPPAPLESAAYFAVAECLSNVVKHAGAQHAWVVIAGLDGRLRLQVGDDGRGGANPGQGTGLAGVARRLSALDGTMTVDSPAGGPTLVTMEVPCALWSPKTTPSSATA